VCVRTCVCPQDNSRTRASMSTKLGRFGQRVTLCQRSNTDVDLTLIPDVDPGSLPLSLAIRDGAFYDIF